MSRGLVLSSFQCDDGLCVHTTCVDFCTRERGLLLTDPLQVRIGPTGRRLYSLRTCTLSGVGHVSGGRSVRPRHRVPQVPSGVKVKLP